MSGTELPQKISDEEGRALAFTVARALPRIVSRNAEGVQTFDAPMLAQCLREAGYRREADVLREAAEGLRKRERRLGERGMSSQFISGIHYAASALSAQAQPLLAAGSEVESLEPVESSEGQERSEEKEHG